MVTQNNKLKRKPIFLLQVSFRITHVNLHKNITFNINASLRAPKAKLTLFAGLPTLLRGFVVNFYYIIDCNYKIFGSIWTNIQTFDYWPKFTRKKKLRESTN